MISMDDDFHFKLIPLSLLKVITLVAMVFGITNTIETVRGETMLSPKCTPQLPMLYYLLICRRMNGIQL